MRIFLLKIPYPNKKIITCDIEYSYVNLAKMRLQKYKNVDVLWASTREPYNYLQAKKLNCHIITVPPSIIEKIEKFGKPFKKLTTDTVKGFLIDSKKSKSSKLSFMDG